jgi:hypothetical protein
MRWVVIPDLQVPDHDPKAVASTYRFIEAIQPDGILCVGDEADQPEPSRWNKGYAGEFSGTLQAGLDQTHAVLAGYRDALGEGKPFHLMRSNHGERIRTYVRRYAAALGSLRSLDYESLLGLDQLGITYHSQPYEFAPGWLLAHGDEGSLSQTAAGTALGLAKRWGKSVVCGHTHRAGLVHHHLSVNGKVSSHLFGLEVGHLMLYGNGKSKADYLKAGSANWQQAIALIDVDGKRVQPTLIPMFNSTVVWEGQKF